MQSDNQRKRCWRLLMAALGKADRMFRQDKIDGLVAFMCRLSRRAGATSYVVLKPTIEARAWRKEAREGTADRPLCSRTMQRYCDALAELGLVVLRRFDSHTGLTLRFLQKGQVPTPPRELSAPNCLPLVKGSVPTEQKPLAQEGQAQPDSPAPADAVPGAPVEETAASLMDVMAAAKAAANAGLADAQQRLAVKRRKPAWMSAVGEDHWRDGALLPHSA